MSLLGVAPAPPRPFYLVGHNPNTIADVNAALDAGANAIEPDVNVYEDAQGELCISEVGTIDGDEGGDSNSPALSQFLDALHSVATERPELALIIFDCKPKVATALHGYTLLNEIRTRLTFDTNVNVVISVSKRSELAIFDLIMHTLGPREGLMVDEEDDPKVISDDFDARGVVNQCFGNGVANLFQDPAFSPHLRPSIEMACGLKAASGHIKFVYTWSLGEADAMREAIRIGVDGIIPGEAPSAFDKEGVSTLRAVTDELECRALIRFAERADNPFLPANAAYALIVKTGDSFGAGTDANVTFTLTGRYGSSSKTVDTSLRGSVFGGTPGRMEEGSLDYVTLPSQDLGDLISLTVQRDNQGLGPDWELADVVVRSHYGGQMHAAFGRWIDTTSPFTQPLVPLT